MSVCPTVKIRMEPSEGNPSGVVVINESDFDATTMVLDGAAVAVPVVAEPVVLSVVNKVTPPWGKE